MKMNFSLPRKLTSGFSLVEVLASVTIIGIIIFLAIPNIVQMRTDAEANVARARAEALNMALASYVQALGPQAANADWPGSADTNGIYNRLKVYIAFPATSLATYMPQGYGVTNFPSAPYPMTNPMRATGPGL